MSDTKLDEFAKKAMLNFEDLFKDCQELDGIKFEEKYGIDKWQGKQILDGLWLKKLDTFGKDFKVYADMVKVDFAKKVKEVEIFEVGYHNGQNFTDADIDKIIEATNEMMKKQNMQIPIKLGHSDEQKVAKELFQEDSGGMPALGWVKNLKKVGKKIVADLTEIPDKLYNMLEEKLYATRSIELWEGFVNNKGDNVGSVITGLALLGAVPPAVTNLANIFDAESGKVTAFECIADKKEISKGEIKMTEEVKTEPVVADEVKTDEVKTDEVKTEEVKTEEVVTEPVKTDMSKAVGFDMKQFSSEAEISKRLMELKKDADVGAEAIKELAEFKKTEKKTKVDALLNELGVTGNVLPFQAEELKPILMELQNKDVEYFDKGLEVTKKEGAYDLLVKFLKSLPNQIKLEEMSHVYNKDNRETLDDVAKKVMFDKKVTYEVAVKEVLRNRPELADTDSTPEKKGVN